MLRRYTLQGEILRENAAGELGPQEAVNAKYFGENQAVHGRSRPLISTDTRDKEPPSKANSDRHIMLYHGPSSKAASGTLAVLMSFEMELIIAPL
jgi:hypothetical protein